MNKQMKKTALAAAFVLLAGASKAEPLSWTEVGLGYNRVDAGDESVDAFDIKGSIGFANLFHAQFSYLDGSEGGSNGIDFDGYEIRAGVHPTVGEKTQAVVDLIYFDYSADPDFCPSCDFSEDGWGLGFGIRHQMGDQFEARAQIDYFDGSFDCNGCTSSDFNNTTYSFGGRYYWMPNLFTGVTITLNGLEGLSVADFDGDALRLDVGWSFGADVL